MWLERDEDLISDEQASVCAAHGAESTACDLNMKVGIALATLGDLPLNALRHRPENGTTGWYIWGGELSQAPDFFLPMHAAHLAEYVPQLVPYLALAPGWRVLIARPSSTFGTTRAFWANDRRGSFFRV